MAIPPFPSQDLAKLILGYLADEQLMTAYDEFLQASPYLDAFRNEYDRLFMTSLKNILAEYRAVKIYVETCKPICLRKRILQCTNMLDVVKFLICNIDLDRIQQICVEKPSVSKPVNTSKKSCEVCNASNLVNCICTNSLTSNQSSLQSTNLENSVQTTLLTDLPGHVTTRKKGVKLLEKTTLSNASCDIKTDNVSQCEQSTNVSLNKSKEDNLSCKTAKQDTTGSVQKINEFENALKSVSDNNKSASIMCNSNSELNNVGGRNGNSFQAFVTGIRDSGNSHVPDSSTSESVSVPVTIANTSASTNLVDVTNKIGIKENYVRIASKSDLVHNRTFIKVNELKPVGVLKPIPDEHKIKIISDVKVDEKLGNTIKMPPLVRTATSTPLVRMQTILINGTPAYKKTFFNEFKYTKDEIMAMPTIILVPTSGSTPTVQTSSTYTSNAIESGTTTYSSSAMSLGPLVIDVAPSAPPLVATTVENKTNPTKPLTVTNENNLIKTVDIKNASVPKDNTVSCANKPSTPHLLPPIRKSSSTPRRTSHVRVLDFTTPRRILTETLSEIASDKNSSNSTEVVLSGSPNLVSADATSTQSLIVIDDTNDDKINSTEKVVEIKDNVVKTKANTTFKSSWDADLRAIIEQNAVNQMISPSQSKIQTKKKSKVKKPPDDKTEPNTKPIKESKKSVNRKKSTSKSRTKKAKKEEIIEEPDNIVEGTVEVPVKPNINIISGSDWGTTSTIIHNEKVSNKMNEVDTPEMERLSLQNEIGAKLNISDLLETPYKQALYDIQMETPRFLGPDLPHDPLLSDIKITNIPTPRFLATPKPTPSSYSSRPTDYSSGGSYYKPDDDMDYVPNPEDLGCAVTSPIENIKPPDTETVKSSKKDKATSVKSRPVRQCTKNISYVNSPYPGKTKDMDKVEDASLCSELTSVNKCLSGFDKDAQNSTNVNCSKTRPVSKRKTVNNKKSKSPVKRESPKPFLKIKPRRPTPPKSDSKSRRKTSETYSSRKKTSSKDKVNSVTPVVAAVPTKSRRKSSTPRKLHCTKPFHSESSGHDSPEIDTKKNDTKEEISALSIQDSDTEQLALRWSDDGSQDGKLVKDQSNSGNETDDILKIKEYIETTDLNKTTYTENEESLQDHLIRRGFDAETARSIERDLLDSPKPKQIVTQITFEPEINKVEDDSINNEGNNTLKPEVNAPNIVVSPPRGDEEDEEEDEIELSVHECNEDSFNYISMTYDETKEISNKPPVKLKDNFCMEVCLEDETIRLKSQPFRVLFEVDPIDYEVERQNKEEAEIAIRSISNFDRLYTPMKEAVKAQCYEIFDSTLTSLDTPLKANSPKRKIYDTTVTEIVLEVEKVEVTQTISQMKDKSEQRKRKRVQSGNTSDESLSDSKKARPETQYLLNTANIQNIDIESVLSKLHGP